MKLKLLGKILIIFQIVLLIHEINSEISDDELDEVLCHFNFGAQICDCNYSEKMMKLRFSTGSSRQMKIQNCKNVLIRKDSLSGLESLRSVQFENIENLMLEEFALKSTKMRPPFSVKFLNVTTNIPANLIRGNLRELRFESSKIEKIHSFAITALSSRINSLAFVNSEIMEVESTAFRKISIDDLLITNTKFSVGLVSKAFYDCDIKNIKIGDSSFESVNPSSFSLKEVSTLKIINNTFSSLDGEAFVMKISDSVEIHDNNMEKMHALAFKGIEVDSKVFTRQTAAVNFDFNNNHVGTIFPNEDINFGRDFNLRINHFYIDLPYSCESVRSVYDKEFFKSHSDRIFMRSAIEENYETLYIWQHIKCIDREKWFMIFLIVLGVLVFLVLITVFLWIYCWRRKSKRKLTYVVPEPKTYRETVIVTQIENHGLLRTDF